MFQSGSWPEFHPFIWTISPVSVQSCMPSTKMTFRDVSALSSQPISGFQHLMAYLCMLSGCHSAFPSDLVHVYGFHWGQQHLSMSAVEQVLLLRGGSCWVTVTHSSRHAHTHAHAQYARLEKNLDEHLTYLYFSFMALLYLYSIFVGASVKVMFISTEQLFNAFFFFLTWIWWPDIKFNMVPIYNTVYETTAVTVFSVSMEFLLMLPVNGCCPQLYLANMAVACLIFL